ncbi:MAG: hypothetical protein V2A76_02135 [Planctomycetota bacterium]
MSEASLNWREAWLPRGGLPAPLDQGHGPVSVARSPGRLDFLGGEAAFGGSMILAWPIREGCEVAVRAASDRRVVALSAGFAGEPDRDLLEWSLDELLSHSPEGLRQSLVQDARTSWGAHLIPLVLRISRQSGGTGGSGLRVLVRSSIPRGVGLAASSALELAAARALADLCELDLGSRKISDLVFEEQSWFDPLLEPAVLESLYAARAGRLLPILCQASDCAEPETLSKDQFPQAVLLPDSGGGWRENVLRFRVAAGMGYRLVADQMGLELVAGQPAGGNDPYYGGYLANIDPVTFASEFRDRLPPELLGEAFLSEYDGLVDARYQVDPAVSYPVRNAVRFVLAENHRTCTFISALHRHRDPESTVPEEVLGALLEQSLAESRTLDLVSRQAVFLAQQLKQRGDGRGVLGVRSSAGQGVLVLLSQEHEELERTVAQSVATFEREYGGAAVVLRGSSEGAGAAESLLRIDA